MKAGGLTSVVETSESKKAKAAALKSV